MCRKFRMNILITGGTGFIVPNVVDAYINEGA